MKTSAAGGFLWASKGRTYRLAACLRIVDTFDAMTSRSPTKDPIPPYKAAQIMVGRAEEIGEGQTWGRTCGTRA